MTVVEDILKSFLFNSSDGPTYHENGGYPFFSFNDGLEYGVIVEVNSGVEDIDEFFTDARFYTRNEYFGICSRIVVLS